jgi:hypothetical protein
MEGSKDAKSMRDFKMFIYFTMSHYSAILRIPLPGVK